MVNERIEKRNRIAELHSFDKKISMTAARGYSVVVEFSVEGDAAWLRRYRRASFETLSTAFDKYKKASPFSALCEDF